jgi:hypothetical protein
MSATAAYPQLNEKNIEALATASFALSDCKQAAVAATSALPLPEGISKREWEQIGDQLKPAIIAAEEAGAVGWPVGDWLAYGIKAFGELKGKHSAYAAAERITGFSRQTLYQYASVAKAVPAYNRIIGLSFSHHFAAAALAPRAQGAMLDMALDRKLRVRGLKAGVRAFQLFESTLGEEKAFLEAQVVAAGGPGNSIQARAKALGIELPRAPEKKAIVEAKEEFPPIGEFQIAAPYACASVVAFPNTYVRRAVENPNGFQVSEGVLPWPGHELALAVSLEECAMRCAEYAAAMRERIEASFTKELERVANGDRITPSQTPQVYRIMNPEKMAGSKFEPRFVAPPHYAALLEAAFVERRRRAVLTPSPSDLATSELEAA